MRDSDDGRSGDPEGAGLSASVRVQSITRTLVEAARAGDREAFATIVRTHFRIAYAVALSIVGDPTAAEDVVQDAFVRCWQRMGQCREPSAFGGWMRSIVRSVALNHIERERVRAASPLDRTDARADSSPEGELERTLLRDRLTSAMHRLTDVQREVLLLYDLEGFRHAEIAGLLGISELMSRKHLSHARRRMRLALTESSQRKAIP